MKQWPLVASFILFIALCASVAYWAMQVFTPPARPAVAPPPTTQAPPNLDAAATLFGGRSNVAVASNFQLKGVIFPVIQPAAWRSSRPTASRRKPSGPVRK